MYFYCVMGPLIAAEIIFLWCNLTIGIYDDNFISFSSLDCVFDCGSRNKSASLYQCRLFQCLLAKEMRTCPCSVAGNQTSQRRFLEPAVRDIFCKSRKRWGVIKEWFHANDRIIVRTERRKASRSHNSPNH